MWSCKTCHGLAFDSEESHLIVVINNIDDNVDDELLIIVTSLLKCSSECLMVGGKESANVIVK